MKSKLIYIVGILALIIGFGTAWIIKSSQHQTIKDSENQTIATSKTSEHQIWTCSMHPQIRQNEPGLCPICAMDLIPLDNTGSSGDRYFEMTNEAVQLANIQTTIVGDKVSEGNNAIRINGKIKPDETLAASIVAHIPGRIEQLYIRFTGEEIRKGQKIASIYSPDLITAQKELIEVKKLESVSPALLGAAKSKLKNWKITEAQIENILSTGQVQENFTVYADQSGIVSSKKINVGDYIKTGQVLFDVQNLKKVWVLFDAYESDISKIKVGNTVSFSTTASPTKTFSAKITFIDPYINPNSRVASVRAEVNNSSGQLKPEMFVQGVLQGRASKSNELSVPKSAVLWTGERSVVYVKVKDTDIPSFEYREVMLGSSKGTSYVVKEGLNAGEEVVTNGAFVIDASSQLNNQTSMMNKKVMLEGQDHSAIVLPDYTSTTPVEFKAQLSKVISKYIEIKNALVESDVATAKKEALELLNESKEVDMNLLKHEAHILWMEKSKAMQLHAKSISELDNIEKQRAQFEFLSQVVIEAVTVFGVDQGELYIQFCPMVNNNKGANWISKDKNIKNPYYGQAMLTCGENIKTIK